MKHSIYDATPPEAGVIMKLSISETVNIMQRRDFEPGVFPLLSFLIAGLFAWSNVIASANTPIDSRNYPIIASRKTRATEKVLNTNLAEAQAFEANAQRDKALACYENALKILREAKIEHKKYVEGYENAIISESKAKPNPNQAIATSDFQKSVIDRKLEQKIVEHYSRLLREQRKLEKAKLIEQEFEDKN